MVVSRRGKLLGTGIGKRRPGYRAICSVTRVVPLGGHRMAELRQIYRQRERTRRRGVAGTIDNRKGPVRNPARRAVVVLLKIEAAGVIGAISRRRDLVGLIRHQVPPRNRIKELVEILHLEGAGRIQGGLPVGKKLPCVSAAIERSRSAAGHRPVFLLPQDVWARRRR